MSLVLVRETLQLSRYPKVSFKIHSLRPNHLEVSIATVTLLSQLRVLCGSSRIAVRCDGNSRGLPTRLCSRWLAARVGSEQLSTTALHDTRHSRPFQEHHLGRKRSTALSFLVSSLLDNLHRSCSSGKVAGEVGLTGRVPDFKSCLGYGWKPGVAAPCGGTPDGPPLYQIYLTDLS